MIKLNAKKRFFPFAFAILFILPITLFGGIGVAQESLRSCEIALNKFDADAPSAIEDQWQQFTEFISQKTKTRIDGEINPAFGDKTDVEPPSSHRLAIRGRLAELFEFKTDILDLKVIPKPKSGSISISHTNGMGGFAHSNRVVVGFDVERASSLETVNPMIFKRILTDDEQALSIPKRFLWSLKEAGLKSLIGIGPKEARDFEIFKAEKIDNGIIHVFGEYVDTFSVYEFEGWAIQIEDFIFAICVRK